MPWIRKGRAAYPSERGTRMTTTMTMLLDNTKFIKGLCVNETLLKNSQNSYRLFF